MPPLLLALAILGPGAEPTSVAVLQIAASGGIEASAAEVFSELLQDEIRQRGPKVIGRSDVDQVLGLEKLKDSLGCTSTTCLAEIGGALGVDELVTGSIAKLGGYLVVTVKRIDPQRGEVRRQAVRKLKGAHEGALVEVVGPLVAELFGRAQDVVRIRAVDMTRSRDVAAGGPWGEDVIHNAPPYNDRPNLAEYDLTFPAAGTYELWVEFAAQDPRPVELSWNGAVVAASALTKTTGSWQSTSCQWSREAVVTVQPGLNTLRLYGAHYFPHIRAFKLVRVP